VKTLVAKELRQILPAHVLLAGLFAVGWWLAVTPAAAVVPHASDLADRNRSLAMLYLLEGLILGFAQFGLERWNGTQAYLLHRGTGAGGAFAAKVAAGLAALAFLIAAPPLVFALAHVVAGTWIEGAPLASLGHAMAASTTAFAGFAVGAFATQVRGTWGRLAACAILGGCTLLYAAMVAAEPIDALNRASAARFVLAQAAIATAVLAVAFGLFRRGAGEGQARSPVTAAAFAVVVLELLTLPYVVGPSSMTKVLRRSAIAAGPQVVQDPAGELYLAERRGERDWSIRDATGRPVPDALASAYDGYGRSGEPFLSLYRPRSTPLSWIGPQDDALEPFAGREWHFAHHARRVLTRGDTPHGDAWYDIAEGRIGTIVRDETGRGRWVELAVPPRMGVCYPKGREFGERFAPLLVDAEAGRLWSLEAEPGREPELVERHLPEGRRVQGVVRVHSKARLRVGLHEPVGTSDSLAVVAEDGPYLWDGERLAPLAEVEPEWLSDSGALESDPDAVALRLAPVDIDGLGYSLEVRDAVTGELRLEADYRARGLSAALMHAATLLSAPFAALVSWTRPPLDPRTADRTHEGPLSDPMLAGRSRSGLLLAVWILGALLAASTWRGLGRTGTPPLARAVWTAGTLAFGISAWFLARIFGPAHVPTKSVARREAAANPRMEIVTA
jgi:hypothetical protein